MGHFTYKGVRYPEKFSAAIWPEVDELSYLVRTTLKELGYKFTREESQKEFSKVVFVVPMPKFAYVYVFQVHEPADIRIKVFNKAPTASGIVHMLEIEDLNVDNISCSKKFIRALASKMSRKPWKFSMMDRFRYGFAAPEYVRAKSKWKKMGVE